MADVVGDIPLVVWLAVLTFDIKLSAVVWIGGQAGNDRQACW